MIILTLERFCYSPLGTFGMLTSGDGFSCYTVEEIWKHNTTGNSCIPEGVYRCRRGHFPKHGEAFEVCEVPGRTAILFHVANTIADIEGCIGPGETLGALDNVWAVLNSGHAYQRFMTYLKDEQEFVLDIRQYRP